MLKKKVCMLGAFAVGKTSLVRRYVHSLFSEKYHTTVGVKVDKKTVACNDSTVDLILWIFTARMIFRLFAHPICGARPAACWWSMEPGGIPLPLPTTLSRAAGKPLEMSR